MGKHSRGGIFGGGERGPSRENRIPAERVLTTENNKPLEDAPRRAGIESAPARLRAERDRRRTKTKRILLSVLGAFVFLVAAGAVALFAWASQQQDRMQPVTFEEKEQLDLALDTAEPGKPFTVLLMGVDVREGDPSTRTDTMIVARVDPQAKKVWMLSIPRDTKVLIPGHGYGKINSAYTYGGSALAIKTVKGFTGLKIDHYMEVNFVGFIRAVDKMGGVWINVPKAINDKRAASQSVHQRAYKIPAGWQKLDGEHALTFVRSRKFGDADFSRMSDQQIFFRAVADQLAHRTDVPTMIRVVNSITPYIKTDLSIMDLLKTALTMKDAGAKNMYTASVGGEWISPYIIPNEESLKTLVKNFKDGVPFDKSANIATEVNPGATTSVAATKTATPKATTVSSVKPSSIKITVRNGAGVSGYAAQAASILKAKGFKVKGVGNANQSVYKQTLVVYKKDLAGAKAVAEVLVPGAKIVKNRGLYTSPTEILVVVGKDWDLSKIPAASVTTE